MASTKNAKDKIPSSTNVGLNNEIVSVQNTTPIKVNVNKKTWLILFLVIIIIGVILLIDNSVTVKFKTVSYNNNQSSIFNLKFYKSYYLSYSYDSSTPASKEKSSGQNETIALASKVSINNKYPIWLTVSSSELSSSIRRTYETNNRNLCLPEPTLFTIYNTYSKQHVHFCNFTLITDRQAYIGYYVYKQKLYTVIVTQVIDKNLPKNSNIETVGLSDYQSDLNTIVGSIKPTTK